MNRSSKKAQKPEEKAKKVSNLPGVPLLLKPSEGSSGNLMIWKKRLAEALLEKYGDLGRFIVDGEYYVPPEIEVKDEELTKSADPHGFRRDEIKFLKSERVKHIGAMSRDRTACYATIKSVLSPALEEAVKELDGYEDISTEFCPYGLYKLSVSAASGEGRAISEHFTAQTARKAYNAVVMEDTSELSEFYEEFKFVAEQMLITNTVVVHAEDENMEPEYRPLLSPQQIACDFLDKLCTRYDDFKDKVANDATSGAADIPGTLAEMYARAAAFRGVPAKAPRSHKTVFAALEQPRIFSGRCFKCNEIGHPARACTNEPAAAASSAPHAVAADPPKKASPSKAKKVTVGYTIFAALRGKHIGRRTVILDSGANTSRFANRKLLRDVRVDNTLDEVTAFGGQKIQCQESGELPGYFRVGVNRRFHANVLSLHEVEAIAQVKYVQGDRYIVTIARKTMLFIKGRHGLFTAEFPEHPRADQDEMPDLVSYSDGGNSSDDEQDSEDEAERDTDSARAMAVLTWERGHDEPADKDQHEDDDSPPPLVSDDSSDDDDGPPPLVSDDSSDDEGETPTGRVLNTLAERRGRFNRRQLAEADRAWDFVKNANITEARALEMVQSSPDLIGCDVTTEGIRNAFDLNVADVAAVKGKTRRTVPPVEEHRVASQTGEKQTLHSDVMFVRGLPNLLSVAQPLNLTVSTALPSQSEKALGAAVAEQIAALGAYGYEVVELRVDRQAALVALQGKLGKVKVEACGSGDHVGTAENRVKTVKEGFRTIVSRLPFRLPNRLVVELTFYVVKRLNSQPSSFDDKRCPRVKVTGRKISFDKEYSLGFGDYVEARDPAVKSNDADAPRTNSAIALWPTGNLTGSWKFFDVTTGETIVRSQWRKLPTTEVVITAMNAWAEKDESGSKRVNAEKVTVEPPAIRKEASSEDAADLQLETMLGDLDQEMAAVAATPADATGKDMQERDQELGTGESVAEEPADQRKSGRGINRPRRFIVNHITLKRGLAMFGAAAEQAVRAEIANMIRKDVFEPVLISQLTSQERRAIIRSSIFLKEKFRPDGTFDKLKARLVADGSMQDKEIYENLNSPTVATTSVLCMLAIAARERRALSTVDVGSAYLNADLDANVIMMLDTPLAALVVSIWPELVLDNRRRGYVRLRKALYGCVQSAKLWYESLKGELEAQGYSVNAIDPCVFNKTVDGAQSTLLVHVDDILCLCASPVAHEELKTRLRTRYVEINADSGPKLSFLGMTVDARNEGVVEVTMGGFLTELLADNPPDGAVTSPANNNLFDFDDQDAALDDARRKRFHTVVAKLLYLGKRIRPDILVAVSFLCTRVTCATVRDEEKLARVLKYLGASSGQSLMLGAGVSSEPLRLFAYVDASYGVHEDGKSHTGAVMTLGCGAIFARSSKQKIVCKSSTEAELVAITDSIGEVIWLRGLLVAQGYELPAAVLYQDNQSTIALCERGGAGHRTKHVKIRNFWVKERLDDGDIMIEYMPTARMLADVLTKPLQGTLFADFKDILIGANRNIMPIT